LVVDELVGEVTPGESVADRFDCRLLTLTLRFGQ